MILSVAEARSYVDALAGWTDEKIEMKLRAVEMAIRAYTNNNFQRRTVRGLCQIRFGVLYGDIPGLKVGDTVQISESAYNDGLFVVQSIIDDQITVSPETLTDESAVLVTKIQYPDDIKDAAVNMLTWDVNNRGKVGIQSETLSRHSVTYYNMGADAQVMGYPVSIMGSLKPYRKMRF